MADIIPTEKYNPVSIKKSDLQVVEALRKQILVSVEGSLAELEYLKSALQSYKGAMDESLDANIQFTDIVSKYTQQKSMGVYNLPGVMANTTASYDITSMKADNQKLAQAKEIQATSDKHRDLYFKMILQNFQDLKTKLQKVAKANQQVFLFLAQLNDDTNQ